MQFMPLVKVFSKDPVVCDELARASGIQLLTTLFAPCMCISPSRFIGMRRWTAFGSLSALRYGAATASAPALHRLLHKSISTAPTHAEQPVADSSSSAEPPTPPTTEDYRALLLDLLLYRQETVGPLLTALKREREELEVKMAQLETHIRSLRQIRDELRVISEVKIDRENRQLHEAIMAAGGALRTGDEVPSSLSQQANVDEVVL
ncbi:hypothetical protein ABL78_6292 [Leptomonas seymouri]|uniref:Uncharacterized protein n=1 Tax=Leptomonas seymouri TaxID=5684 RepID=A0A0N1PC29_LEPSE|nr:hypothetical protein ABL78_6292 [Leptomonas seymouri]|eukprot:KPI84651.1 hypothetical protein ABL78_6292 [Leptomonas seymouri]